MFLIDSLGSLVLTIVYPPEQMPKTNSIVNLAKKIMQMCPGLHLIRSMPTSTDPSNNYYYIIAARSKDNYVTFKKMRLASYYVDF